MKSPIKAAQQGTKPGMARPSEPPPAAQPSGSVRPAEDAAIARTAARSRYLQRVVAELFDERDTYECAGRKSLTKAGAEKLLSCFELICIPSVVEQSELDQDSLVAIDGELRARHGYYEVRAQVTLQTHTGIVMGRACGSANSNETWVNKLSVWDAKNPVLKMAQNRALVAAVLNVVGGSAMFSQDLEDLPRDGVSARAATAVAVPSSAASKQPDAAEPATKADVRPLRPVPTQAGATPAPPAKVAAAEAAKRPIDRMVAGGRTAPPSGWTGRHSLPPEDPAQVAKRLALELVQRDPKAAELIAREIMTDEKRVCALRDALRKAPRPITTTLQPDYAWEDQ